MPEARRAGSDSTRAARILPGSACVVRIGDNVVNNVVRVIRVARHAAHSEQVIESEIMANSPGNVMVGARSISADSYRADDGLSRGIERQAASKHIHATDLVAHHGVIRSAVERRDAAISDARIDGVALLQTKQAAARLDRRKQVRCGKRQSVGLPGAT